MTNINKWLTFNYEITGNLITSNQIELACIKFYKDVLTHLKDDQYILIIFRIKTSDNLYRNISTFQTISKLNIKEFINICNEYWLIKTENYIQEEIIEIKFNYKIIGGSLSITTSKINSLNNKLDKPKLLKFKSFNFPQTMDITQWGNVHFMLNDSEAIVYKFRSKAQYHIKFDNTRHECGVLNML